MTLTFSDAASYIPYVISVASAIAAALPTPVPGSVWASLVKGINFLALNFGHAKNAAPTVAQKVSVADDVASDLESGVGPGPVKPKFVP